MTTVAWDGKTLSVDTLITGSFKCYQSKVFRLSDGGILAGSGDMDALQALHRSIEGGLKFPKGSWDAIMLDTDGTVCAFDDNGCTLDITDQTYAVGSGSAYAMGAMLAGKTSAKAVEIAMKLDPHTGGEIETIRLRRRKTTQ